jgi:hypothetical protein
VIISVSGFVCVANAREVAVCYMYILIYTYIYQRLDNAEGYGGDAYIYIRII